MLLEKLPVWIHEVQTCPQSDWSVGRGSNQRASRGWYWSKGLARWGLTACGVIRVFLAARRSMWEVSRFGAELDVVIGR